MQAPCKECSKRYLGCHSKCPEYIKFDNENKVEREARAMATILKDHSPSQEASYKKNNIERMRHGAR